jgi:hypothetical protein
MINFTRLNLVLLSILLSSTVSSTLFAQRVTQTYQPPADLQSGQIINRPVIQGQRVFQGQIIQGQPIQGQPIQGQIIQGQPIQGQIIQAPVIQGRPIRGNAVQPQPGAVQPKPSSTKQRNLLAAARAKIEQQAQSIITLTDANSKLSRVEETNNAMRSEYARLKKAYDQTSKELDELKINQAMKTAEPVEPANTDAQEAQQAKLNQLSAQYQKSVEQNGAMSGQIKRLTEENAEIKNRLKNVRSAGGDMSGLETKLNNANTRITQMGQQNQTLLSQNNSLTEQLKTANANREDLNMRYSTLSQESAKLRAEYQTASETNSTLGQQVTDLSTQNRDYLAAINARPAATPSAKTNAVAASRDFGVAAKPDSAVAVRRDSGVAAEHDRVLALNADLKNENDLLMEQIADLERKLGSTDTPTAAKESTVAVAVPTLTADAAPKFNIMKWLIPFLLIGLGIGLYVFWTEETGQTVATGFTSTKPRPHNDA